jgi:hypothetical protein
MAAFDEVEDVTDLFNLVEEARKQRIVNNVLYRVIIEPAKDWSHLSKSSTERSNKSRYSFFEAWLWGLASACR